MHTMNVYLQKAARTARWGISGALLAALMLAGCNTKPTEVVPADAGSAEKLDALEKRLQAVEHERDALARSGEAAGLEAQSLSQILADLRQRLKAVEERGAAAPASMDPSGSASSGSTGSTTPSNPTASTLDPAGSDGTYSDDQIGKFQRLADEAQKRKDAAQQAERVKRELARANVTLTPAQEEAVIKLQSQYQEKMRELYRGGFGRSEAERTEVTEKLQALRGQFETDLRAQVPATEADKIVETMKAGFPGFFRAPGGGRTGGMNGNMGGN